MKTLQKTSENEPNVILETLFRECYLQTLKKKII